METLPESKLTHGRVDQAKPVDVVIGQVPVSEHHLHDLVKAQQDTLADASTRFFHRASSSHRECFDLQEKHYDVREVVDASRTRQEKRETSALRDLISPLRSPPRPRPRRSPLLSA